MASSKQEADDAEFSLEDALREMERSLWISSPSGSEEADSAADRIKLTLSLMSLCSHSVTVLDRDDDAGADRFRASYAELFAGAYQDLFHWIMERPGDEIDGGIWEKLFGDWESLKSIEKTKVDPMCNISPHAMLRFLSKALVYVFARASRGRAELPPDAVWDNFLCFHLGRVTFASLVDPSAAPAGGPLVLDRDAVARLGTVMAVALRRPGRNDNAAACCCCCAASAACALARALASHAASRPLDELAPGSAPHLLDALATALLAEGARRGTERRQRRRRRAQRDGDGDDKNGEAADTDGGVVVAGIARAAHEVLHYLVGIHARRRGGEHDGEGRAAWLARREAALETLLRLRHRLPPAALSGLMGWLGDEAELCLDLDVAGILETEKEAEAEAETEAETGSGW